MPSRTFIARGQKSRPGFKASRDRLTLLFGTNAISGNQCLFFFYHFKSPGALENYPKSTLPVRYKWNNKAWITNLFIAWFTEYFQPTVEINCSEK